MKYVYLIQSREDGRYKIGISKHPNKRIGELQTANSSELKLIDKYQTIFPYEIEIALHSMYSASRKKGEWFELQLDTEINFIENCRKIEKNIKYLKKNSTLFM
jgi:hypothetical protein